MIKNILLVFACFVWQACTSMNQGNRFLDRVNFEKINVLWDQRPNSIAFGSDAQALSFPSGDIKVLYLSDHDEGIPNVYLTKSNDDGVTFSNSKLINSGKNKLTLDDGISPQLAVGTGSEVYATWEENHDIKLARSLDFGRSFLSTVRVNDDMSNAAQSFHQMKVAKDGTIFIAWVDGRQEGQEESRESVYLARSIDKGKTFENNIRISGNVCHCCKPAIAFGKSGQVFVSWRHEFPNNIRKVVVASSQDNGLTWSKPIPVSNRGWQIDGCINSGPALDYINGKLYVAWFTGADSRSALKFSWSSDGGASFYSIGKIQEGVSNPNYPQIENVNGEPWIIFQGTDANAKTRKKFIQAWIVKITEEGRLSLPQAISDSQSDIEFPYLYSGDKGRVYATWTSLTNSGRRIVMSRGRMGGG